MIGQDGSKVVIKHGPYTISVHPCRVILKNEGEKLEEGEEVRPRKVEVHVMILKA